MADRIRDSTNLGLKKYFPKTSVIGYQGFILPYNYNLHLIPIKKELSTGQIPKTIYVIGKELVSVMKKYCQELNVKTAPAFRFAHVFSNSRKLLNNHTILVALPISFEYSYNLIKLIIEVYEKMNFNNIKWIIKPHPSLDYEKLKLSFEKWPSQFEENYDKFSNCLLSSSIVIGGSSSTAMEALTYGIPVIIISNRNSITQNPIPALIPKIIWGMCYTSNDCIEELNKLLFETDDLVRKKQNEIGQNIKENYFEPITREKISIFFS